MPTRYPHCTRSLIFHPLLRSLCSIICIEVLYTWLYGLGLFYYGDNVLILPVHMNTHHESYNVIQVGRCSHRQRVIG